MILCPRNDTSNLSALLLVSVEEQATRALRSRAESFSTEQGRRRRPRAAISIDLQLFGSLTLAAMRDLAGCFASQAVRVVCSTTGTSSPAAEASPVRTAVITCFYRSILSTKKELLTRVAWSGTSQPGGVCLSVEIEDSSAAAAAAAAAGDSDGRKPQLLHKKKGTRCFVAGDSVVSLHWDISAAKFESGPEPRRDFYVVAIADGELVLLLGEACHELLKIWFEEDEAPPIAEVVMVSRREQVRGATGLYSTRAQFGGTGGDGKTHEISIGWRKGEEWDAADGSELRVAVDRKTLVHVKRLRWNFRGNETIFVDGATIDVMWDVHGWWFGGPPTDGAASRCALFMFRTRRTLEHRLWLEEEPGGPKERMPGFSLLIQAIRG